MNVPDEKKLKQLVKSGCPAYYFYSGEPYLVRRECDKVCKLLAAEQDGEVTVLDGPTPDMEQIIMAAGTISFFGTRRIVVMPELAPSSYGDKDIDELCTILAETENAVLIIGSVFDAYKGRPKPGKRAQKLITQCKKSGWAEELVKPDARALKTIIIQRAEAQGTQMQSRAAAALLDRCGEDPFLLENEVDKLCALSGYTSVSADMVSSLGTVSLDADVFEMIQMITSNNIKSAYIKLDTLLRLRQEPIAIAAAMISSFTDMYRVSIGKQQGKNYSVVFGDFKYPGKSDYRLNRASQAAYGYTVAQLEQCLEVLLELDVGLKSQPVAPDIQLETALCRLALVRGRR